jgi:FixJ family two-component response regulator
VANEKPIVFVVDDDASAREALEGLIRSAGLRVQMFASGQEFLRYKLPNVPSCLVLDVRMPGLSGLELQTRLTEIKPVIPVIFITGHGDVPMSVQAMKAGAVEFLMKPYIDDNLLEAIQQALEKDAANRQEHAHSRALHERHDLLTPREREVMAHVVSGLLNKQIAAELGTSEITIKVHRGQVMHKMKAASLADLVKMSEELRRDGVSL